MSPRPSDPTERFSSRVEAYVRSRPGYPPDLVPLLAREIGLRSDWTVADIGSGTGLSAEPFLAYGNTVLAVEPNAPMREAAEERLGGHPGFRSISGTAEATTLEGGSVDLVLAAQAFHWFDPVRAREEFRRILRPSGWAAVVWNTRRTDATPFLRAYEDLLLRYGTDYETVRHDRSGSRAVRTLYPGDYERHTLPNLQRLDQEGLEARLLSSSYTPEPGDDRHLPMRRAMERLFVEHAADDHVELLYETEVYLGRL